MKYMCKLDHVEQHCEIVLLLLPLKHNDEKDSVVPTEVNFHVTESPSLADLHDVHLCCALAIEFGHQSLNVLVSVLKYYASALDL